MTNLSVFCKNLRFFANKKGVKLGELEKSSGTSVGYISRLSKDETMGVSPVVGLAITASKEFNVTIDALLFLDFSNMTPNELYISSFISKLITDTRDDKLIWTKEDFKLFDNYQYRNEHPLFEPERISEIKEDYVYHSHFNIKHIINGDCFNVKMQNGKTIYLMKVKSSDIVKSESHLFELYFVEPDKSDSPWFWNVYPICFIDEKSLLNNLALDLYKTAQISSQHMKLDENVKSIIDGFMRDVPF